jgi:hypothetical protein
VLADHGLYHPQADLRWIDHTAARLDLLARRAGERALEGLVARHEMLFAEETAGRWTRCRVCSRWTADRGRP